LRQLQLLAMLEHLSQHLDFSMQHLKQQQQQQQQQQKTQQRLQLVQWLRPLPVTVTQSRLQRMVMTLMMTQLP
jgi:hypothetical protein